MNKEIEIPEGYEARIEGSKVIIKPNDTEDERMMKEIIQFFKDASNSKTRVVPSGTFAKWAEFLERQKEQNFEGIKDNAVRKYMKLDKFALANMLAERDKTNAEVIEAFESIKEYPKQEWSEEDESNLYNIIEAIKYVFDVSEDSKGSRLITWLKSLPERLNLQPKQEWSEEDEEIISSAVYWLERYLSDSNALDIGRRDCRWTVVQTLNKLKSFHPQPPKEWTIEDAKPGDILHTSSTASSKTFIFKGIRNDEHGTVECFCCYDSEDGFLKGEETLIGWKTDKYRLATTEQCIELGRVMGKSGYIFSFETNQLRKLNKHQWMPSKEHYWEILSKKEKEDSKAIEAPSHQEQPEVDLELELKKEATRFAQSKEFWSENDPFLSTARHFAEWGAINLNTRKE